MPHAIPRFQRIQVLIITFEAYRMELIQFDSVLTSESNTSGGIRFLFILCSKISIEQHWFPFISNLCLCSKMEAVGSKTILLKHPLHHTLLLVWFINHTHKRVKNCWGETLLIFLIKPFLWDIKALVSYRNHVCRRSISPLKSLNSEPERICI